MTEPLPRDAEGTTMGTTLALGDDPLGRSWSLDLQTGEVRQGHSRVPTLGETNSAVVGLAELSIERIARILAEGGWEVCVTPDAPLLHLETEIGLVSLGLLDDGRRLRLFQLGRWADGVEEWETVDERIAGIAVLNRVAYLVRFVAKEDDSGFVASYDLPLTAGVTRAQLLDLTRRFIAELRRALDRTGAREALQ